MVKPTRRMFIGYVKDKYGYSRRRACLLVRYNRSSLYYRSKEQPFNDALRIRIKDIALHRIHYGFCRVHATLRREGWVAGIDRVKRLYRLEGLNLRPKQRKRRRSDVQRDVAMVALGPNEVWSMDFMHDRFANGSSYRLLTVVDVFTRECVALHPDHRLASADVIEVLNAAIKRRGKPEPSAAITVASSHQSLSINGRTGTMSRSTSLDLESQPTTLTANHSTGLSERNS